MTATNLLSTYNTVDTTDTVTITNIGGGQGAGTDADLFIQGDQAVSRRIDNSSLGWTVSTGAGGSADLSATGTHLVVWFGSLTWSLVTNYQVVITSGTNQDAYHDVPSAQFPLTSGGFIPVWVDVTRTPDGAVTNTPTLTAVNGVGIYAVMGNTAGNLKNVQADASFYGTAGYALTATANIGQVLTAEENTSTGLKGVLQEKSGIYFCQARLIIGASDAAASTPVATTYSDSDITIVFPDQPLVATDWMGQTISLGNASTTYSLTGSTITSGNPTGATTRPDLIFTGTSGTATLTNCTVVGMRTVDFTSACTFDGGILDTVNLTQSSAVIKNCEIKTRTATQVACVDDATFGSTTGINNVQFTQAGLGHAIEITSPGSYTFTNIDFSGYGGTAGSNLTQNSGANDAAVLNSSTGSVTISIVGGDTPSIRNVNTGSTTTVVNNINITVSNLKDGTEVRIYDTNTLDSTPPYAAPTELAGVEDLTGGVGTDFNTGSAGGSTDNNTYTFSIASGTAITIRTFNENWIADDVSITPTSTQDVQIAQRQDRVFSNP